MIKDVLKIDKKGDENLLFTSEGMLLSLDDDEFKVFQEFGKEKNINLENKGSL